MMWQFLPQKNSVRLLESEVKMGLWSGIGKAFGLNELGDVVGKVFNKATGAEEANQWQWDMWNAQNAYNAPLAQRQRLEAAGYNPLLNQGWSGGASGGTASAMTSHQGSGKGLDLLGQVSSLTNSFSQAALAREQARKLKHDNDVVEGTPVSASDNSLSGKLFRAGKWLFGGSENSAKSAVQSFAGDVLGIPQAAMAVGTKWNELKKSRGLLDGQTMRLLENPGLPSVYPGSRIDNVIEATNAKKRSNSFWSVIKKLWKSGDFSPFNYLTK